MITFNVCNDAIATMVCDHCGASTEAHRTGSEGIVPPAGWVRSVWVVGILDDTKRPDLHACSRDHLLRLIEIDSEAKEEAFEGACLFGPCTRCKGTGFDGRCVRCGGSGDDPGPDNRHGRGT